MGIPVAESIIMRGPVTSNDMSASSNTNSLNLQMLLAASQCVSSEPENEDYLERKLDMTENNSSVRKPGRPRGTPRNSIPPSPSTSGTVTPTEVDSVEQWLERRKKQQSQAQSRYRHRQKLKQTDLSQELDRLRDLATQYHIQVIDPDAVDDEDESNCSGHVSDAEMPSGSNTPPYANMMGGGDMSGPGHAGGLVHSWSVTNPPQLSLTPQAIAQRKYRAKLKMKRARLQRQVELYSRVLSAHVAPVHLQPSQSMKMDYGPLN